ncbi:MAG: murein biosynthesis integral membrane protein MurJ [Chloroflexia bacterium]|nr:murein biosynthesis integral membrane protein MurJ [Chloroflexia bacterium]
MTEGPSVKAEPLNDPRYAHGGMARHAAIVMTATVFSRLLGMLRQSVIGARFGTSDEFAAYAAAFGIPDTIYLLVIGGALASAFIPVFSAYLARRDDAGAWKLASRVLNLALLASLVAAGLAFLLAPLLVRWVVAPGFAPPLQALTVRLVRLLLLQPILLGLGGIGMAILNTFRRFLLPSLAPLVYNLSIIGGALFLAPRWGIDGLVAGVLIGAGLYVLVMLPGLRLCRMRYHFSWDWRGPGVREVGRLLAPRLLGQMAFQLNFIAIRALASFETQESLAVGALEYAYRLLYLPLGILGVSLGTVSFPTLAEQANAGRMDAFRTTLNRVLRVVLFLSLPATTLLLVLRVPIVQLLFEREAFGPADTAATAQAFSFFVLELSAACLLEIVVRAFYALHDTRTPVIWGVVAVVGNVALGVVLRPALGFAGLALGFSLATIVQTAALLFLLWRRIEETRAGHLLQSGLRSLGAALLAAAAVWLSWPRIMALFGGPSLVSQLLRLGGAGLLGGGLYLALAALLRSPEIGEAWELLRRRNRAA